MAARTQAGTGAFKPNHGKNPERVFASNRLQGKKPRVVNMIVEDFSARLLFKPRQWRRATGAALASTLCGICSRRSYRRVRKKYPATVQGLLRHADVHTTLQLYAHAGEDGRMAAVDTYMAEFTQSGDTALAISG